MEYTVKITKINPVPLKEGSENMLVGFAGLSLEGDWAINNIKVCQRGDGGIFPLLPSQSKVKDGETKYFDIAFPTTKPEREKFNAAIENAYNNS